MTKREYYDLLLKSADDGTFPSVGPSMRSCLYRADQTAACKRRCAVGLLLPDDEYIPDMEGLGVTSLEDRYRSRFVMPEGMKLDDLDYVQRLHDGVAQQGGGWDATRFKADLKQLHCFKEFASA